MAGMRRLLPLVLSFGLLAGCSTNGVGPLGDAAGAGTLVRGSFVSASGAGEARTARFRATSVETLAQGQRTVEGTDVTVPLPNGRFKPGKDYLLYLAWLPTQDAPRLAFAVGADGRTVKGFDRRSDNGSDVPTLMRCVQARMDFADPLDTPTALAREGPGATGPVYRALYACGVNG